MANTNNTVMGENNRVMAAIDWTGIIDSAGSAATDIITATRSPAGTFETGNVTSTANSMGGLLNNNMLLIILAVVALFFLMRK